MESREDHYQSPAKWTLRSRLKRYCLELLTAILFLCVLFVGLSLTAAGVFKEQVSVDAEARPQFDLKPTLYIGALMVLYSLVGLVLEFTNKLNEKVSSTEQTVHAISGLRILLNISSSMSTFAPSVY